MFKAGVEGEACSHHTEIRERPWGTTLESEFLCVAALGSPELNPEGKQSTPVSLVSLSEVQLRVLLGSYPFARAVHDPVGNLQVLLRRNTPHHHMHSSCPAFAIVTFPLFFQVNRIALSHFNFSAAYDTNPSLEYLLLWSDAPSAFIVLFSHSS